MRIPYETLNKSLFAILIFLLPLIFSTNTNELYEFPKTYFLYFLGSTIIFLFIANRLFYPKPIVFPHKLVLLYVGAVIISTIFSSHFYTSLWGYYTRFHGSLVSVLIYLGLYITAVNTFKKEDIEWFVTVILLTLLPMSIYGIYQYLADNTVRVYSTIGQPNWFAAYLSVLLPLALLRIFKQDQQSKQKFFYGVFILGFFALWLTYSLSGYLAFIASISVLLYLNYQTIFPRTEPAAAKKNSLILLSLSAVCLFLTFLTPGIFKGRIEDILLDTKKFISTRITVYAGENTYNVSDAGFIRQGLWKGTLRLIISNPKVFLIGTGPETFPYDFQKYRDLELNYTSEWDFIFNKPHNYYLEVLAQTGVIGFIPYFLILLATLKKKDPQLTPALAGLYVSNIFGWPTAATGLIFWVFVSFMVKGSDMAKGEHD